MNKWVEIENGPIKEKLWKNSNHEITITKDNQYRLWDSEKIKTIGIFETLKKAKEAINGVNA